MENYQYIFTLMVIFQMKHYVSDFPLQREYMLKKTVADWSFIPPLTLHCAVHAIFTLGIVLYFEPALWWLAPFDFAVHFVMDRIKSGPNYLGRYNDRDKSSFWNALGFDQMVHHYTHYYMIFILVTYKFSL